MAAASPLRPRLERLLGELEAGLVERRQVVRLALLAALAGQHTLLIGPPGTAKSELARRLHRAFREARYFERLLTRFSVPEELFGPLSISALEADRYERQTAGFLPEASIAFIDEVFKANSAILNALLTLLNEREFDNGSRRQPCPLISVIGATNEVPDDEVGEAFFDRFLLRLPVGPVSPPGFADLLALAPAAPTGVGEGAGHSAFALDAADRQALNAAAAGVTVPPPITGLLGELRGALADEGGYVSDRRWVKTVWLLRVAAASEGRGTVAVWDLGLLPWAVAPDAKGQAAVADWLAERLGVGQAVSPPRLGRIVEAFEKQLEAEANANDLDYDESGRLRFTAGDYDAIANDAKGGGAALRMTATRQRRYGALHVAARQRQIDELRDRLAACREELAAEQRSLAAYAAGSLWLDGEFAARAAASLDATAVALANLDRRAAAARAGFAALPRLEPDPGIVPEPVLHEPLPA